MQALLQISLQLPGILPHIGPINQPKFKHNIPDRGSRDPTLLWSY